MYTLEKEYICMIDPVEFITARLQWTLDHGIIKLPTVDDIDRLIQQFRYLGGRVLRYSSDFVYYDALIFVDDPIAADRVSEAFELFDGYEYRTIKLTVEERLFVTEIKSLFLGTIQTTPGGTK